MYPPLFPAILNTRGWQTWWLTQLSGKVAVPSPLHFQWWQGTTLVIYQCKRAAKGFVVASEQGYGNFVCTIDNGTKPKKLPRGHSIGRMFTCRKITYVRTGGLRRGGPLLEGGGFLETYVMFSPKPILSFHDHHHFWYSVRYTKVRWHDDSYQS